MEGNSIFVPQYNPIVGHNQWKEMDYDYDFNQEIARSGYADMLHDDDRNEKYQKAITFTIQRLKKAYPNKFLHVLDIGTGTGLLSMMASRAGADLVTACEAFEPMSNCATKILKDNGIGNVCIVPKRSTDLVVGIDMPQKANVLVAELFDTELIGEGALETYRHASEHLLTDDAVLIPSFANVYLQIVESPFLWSHHRIFAFDKKTDLNAFRTGEMEQCGGLGSVYDIQASELQLVPNTNGLLNKQICCLLEEPVLIKRFCFGPLTNDIKLTDSLVIDSYPNGNKLYPIKSGQAHAFIVWWTLEMEPTESTPPISIAPKWIKNDIHSAWRDHWMQAVYFPKTSIFLTKNSPCTIRYTHDSLSMAFDIICPSEEHLSTNRTLTTSNFCSCGLHYTWSRPRLAELNSLGYRDFASKMIGMVNDNVRLRTLDKINIVVLSDCSYLAYLVGQHLNNSEFSSFIYHVDTSPSSCSFLQSIYKTFNLKNKTNIQVFSSIDDVINVFLLVNDYLTNVHNSFTVLLAEPFVFSAILPWDSLHFWYALQHYYTKLSQSLPSLYQIVPSRLRIYAVLVEFENLWRIRHVVERREEFDLTHFDELVLEASSKVDATIEPHPLWEYPAWARSDEHIVFDMHLENYDSAHGKYFENVPKDLIKCTSSKFLFPTASSVNGVAFWAEWLYSDQHKSSDETCWWYAPSGPLRTITPNHLIEWKPYGPQQGVYLNAAWANNTSQVKYINVDVEFDISNGQISVHVN